MGTYKKYSATTMHPNRRLAGTIYTVCTHSYIIKSSNKQIRLNICLPDKLKLIPVVCFRFYSPVIKIHVMDGPEVRNYPFPSSLHTMLDGGN